MELFVSADVYRKVAVEAFGLTERDVQVKKRLRGVFEPVQCPWGRRAPEVLEEVLPANRLLDGEIVGMSLHETQPLWE